ncbi:MAG: preprotein translocase subunit SecE [Gammaproteobacteria bacterium]|nr:MAG: preprotein translocase subunit SecE [Gammaproteobacteria bacterium]
MNAKVGTESSGMDTLKLWLAVLLMCAGIYGFYYFEDQHAVVRALGIIAVAGISFFIAAQTGFGRNILGFVSGANSEVRRVVWPTRTETVQTTLVVLLLVLLIGIFLWLLDMFLLWAVQLLTTG